MSTYLVDTKYPSNVVVTQNPARLRYISAINGRRIEAGLKKFTYVDLACGDGTSLLAFAEAYPEASFIGIDINADHIDKAKNEQRHYGLQNIEFIEKDLTELDSLNINDADFITINGAYSWVDEHVREAVLDFASSALSADGVFYIHYAVLPSRTAIAPLWRIMQEYTPDSVSSVERAERGVQLLTVLDQSKLGYLAHYPAASARVKGFDNQLVEYIAHEALNPAWRAFYHFEIARSLQKRGLYYSGNATYRRNYHQFTVPPTLQAMFDDTADDVKESLSDYLYMDTARTDLFSKMPGNSNRYLYQNQCIFGLGLEQNELEKQVKLNDGLVFTFEDEVFQKLYALLSEASMTLESIIKHDTMAAYSQDEIERALQLLMVTSQIRLFATESRLPDYQQGRKLTIPSAYNRHKLQSENWTAKHLVLVSQVIGGSVKIPWQDAVCLQAVTGDDNLPVNERIPAILQDEHVQKSRPAKLRVTSEQLMTYLPVFLQQQLPKYLQYGIVAEAAG
jgi:hypothetical protein